MFVFKRRHKRLKAVIVYKIAGFFILKGNTKKFKYSLVVNNLMEEAIYQRTFYWGEELRKRDAYLGFVCSGDWYVVIEMSKSGEQFTPIKRPDNSLSANIMFRSNDYLHPSSVNDSVLFEKRIIRSAEYLEKVGGLEKATDELHQLAGEHLQRLKRAGLLPEYRRLNF